MVRKTYVSLTGGLGAQLIGAAIYLDFEYQGRPVCADLRYFLLEPRVARPNTREVSVWSWDLSGYGMDIRSFRSGVPRRFIDHSLVDGPEKLRRGLDAIRKSEIRASFPVTLSDEVRMLGKLEDALVVHLRRGDYLNVASHIVTDRMALEVVLSWAHLIRRVVIVTDSPIPAEMLAQLNEIFEDVIDASTLSSYDAHVAMRMAGVLVASNSQFSLTAALLKEQGLSLIPSRFWGNGNDKLEIQVARVADFRLVKSAR